jgi:hypothetical protein
MSTGDVLSLLGPGGITALGIAIVILALFITGQIVPKSRADELREERDDWKQAYQIQVQISQVQTQTSHIVREVMQGLREETKP